MSANSDPRNADLGETEPPGPDGEQESKRPAVRGAVVLGVGAMVGAGIFALLGEVGAVAGAAVWISFLPAGVISALVGYTVVKLDVRYPSSGGFLHTSWRGSEAGASWGSRRGLATSRRSRWSAR